MPIFGATGAPIDRALVVLTTGFASVSFLRSHREKDHKIQKAAQQTSPAINIKS